MRVPLAAVLLLAANLAIVSCDDDDDHHVVFVDDVTVEITGDPGVDFEAFVEDDDGASSFDGTVPFTADFFDQEDFFRVIVDKVASDTDELCVRAISSDQSRQSCTSQPLGRASVTLVF
ncbi:MAG TPA: hypothetical protein VJV23_04860 [Candidatus Polarisedimenticolia bacterium]|nr:hypothetical protein [Candidatus Polarisedimenticolia bacterium]